MSQGKSTNDKEGLSSRLALFYAILGRLCKHEAWKGLRNSMEMVPYTGNRPANQQRLESTNAYECVVILVPDEHFDHIMRKIEAWFDDRDEIIFVGSGEMVKSDTSYIILEWEGVKVDPLFLKILSEEDMIEDYACYGRDE
jgi:hypothetical protein